MHRNLFPCLVALLIVGISSTYGQTARTSLDCSVFENAIASTQKTAAIIPESLISDWHKALPCLVKVIEAMRPRVNSDNFDDEVRTKFMSVTAALRSILARLDAQDKANKNEEAVRLFINEFRSLDNLDVAWVLAYGVRNRNPDVRLNSLLILANVIDNSTLCIPLDHLYDPALESSDNGRRGRANLLSVISVVAPWAYLENYNNIKRAREFMLARVANSDLSKDTNAILANIDARLQSQTDRSNKSVHIPRELNEACKNYKLNWAKPEQVSY